MAWTKRIGQWLGLAATATALTTGGEGCLARPVGQEPPTTKVNFTSTISQQAVGKVDLLFMIDNSSSMADKQRILKDAVPNLLQGLLRPRCVNAEGAPLPSGEVADPSGNGENHFGCPAGSDPEFKPVSDMHIGIVSSSLGNFGGDVCDTKNVRSNDRAHLRALKPDGQPSAAAQPSNFLAWFPSTKENEDPKRHPPPENPIAAFGDLETNFQDLVIGTDQTGCGLEAQLESIYHFLIQPDPWADVKVDQAGLAEFGPVDTELIRQRADFLRPDSLVAIIQLSDEDDSSADPYALGGQGWAFHSQRFPGSNVARIPPLQGTTAPRGTKICETDPANAECTSCGFRCDVSQPSCQKVKQDPNCRTSGVEGKSGDGFDGYFAPADDDINVRFQTQLMKRRYGIDPQYPLSRYVDGFTKARIPDRSTEHVTKVVNGRREIGGYIGGAKCTNPLFAAKLPQNPGDELCTLPRGTRSPDMIFFAAIGGVPHQLLYPNGYDTSDFDKNRMTPEKWTKVIGQRPGLYDYSGIDPHMVESVEPRAGLTGADLLRGDNGSDPFHGREWNTGKGDRQYACTFDLPEPRACTGADSCDCPPGGKVNPPLCENNTQIKGKAYPTPRQFQVVHALGDQGVIASLCPIQLTNKDAPDYGYKPAVAAIIDRLINALTAQCLPQKLRQESSDAPVSCLVLAQLGEVTDKCADHGLETPPSDILKVFLEQQKQESGDVAGGIDFSAFPVCTIPQRTRPPGQTCRPDGDIAWCYVERASKKCPQEIHFTKGTEVLAGARFSLQCINQFSTSESEPN